MSSTAVTESRPSSKSGASGVDALGRDAEEVGDTTHEPGEVRIVGAEVGECEGQGAVTSAGRSARRSAAQAWRWVFPDVVFGSFLAGRKRSLAIGAS